MLLRSSPAMWLYGGCCVVAMVARSGDGCTIAAPARCRDEDVVAGAFCVHGQAVAMVRVSSPLLQVRSGARWRMVMVASLMVVRRTRGG